MASKWGLPPWRDPDPDDDDEDDDERFLSFEYLFFGFLPFHSSMWCAACPAIGVPPFRPAIPQKDERISRPDDLCRVHRARATEGACVLCGSRLVWMEIHQGGGFGSCRACYATVWGEDEASRLEEWRNTPS